MSDYSHSSSPSNSQSPRYSPRSPNYSDHSMEEAWSPRPFRSPNYPSSPDFHYSSSSNHSQSPRSSSNIEQDEISRLSPEEDPGPGSVQVQVSDSSTIHFMDKRSLALKSEYFRSYLVRFHTSNMDMHMMNEKTVELNSEFVSSEAWAVLKMYVEFGKLQLHDEVAFEVLQASNYLQMDSVQADTVEYLKKLVSKTNFLTVYDFAVLRGITTLSNYITSTIIKPAEVMRRRKYGGFDLNLKLGQLVFKCHWSVLSSMSQKIKSVLGDNQMVDRVVDSSSFGITSENSQLFYNVFELVYLGREEFSIYSFEEAISIFKILQTLKFDYKFIQPCLTALSRLVNLTNYQDIYQVGDQLGHEGVKNIALYFLMYKIEQLKTEQFFFSLPCKDFCKILSHSLLNVPSEFCVVELIISWLSQQDITTVQLETMAMEMFGNVRWARVSKAEMEHLMKKDLVHSSRNIQTCLKTLIAENVEKEARCWPRLLVVVEQPPESDRRADTEGGSQLCCVQSYDTDTKLWSHLADIPGSVMGYSVTSLQNTLVLTSSNSSVPYLPIASQTYDIWADNWSKEPQLASEEAVLNEKEHSTVEVQDKVYTVLTPKHSQSQTTMCLHMLTGVLSDSPLWSLSSTITPHTTPEIPQLASSGELVHVIGQRTLTGAKHSLSLDTFNTATQAWTGGYLSHAGPRVVQAGWVGWGCGVARVGGVCLKTMNSSNQCVVFPVQGGDAKPLASLVKERVRPGVVQFKGMMFAAGGYKQRMVEKEKKRKKKKMKAELVIEPSVEYYVPELDCWNLMRTQPKLSYGRVTMVVVDKPIRLMAKGNVTFKMKKGVKRPLAE